MEHRSNLYDFPVTTIDGAVITLSQFKGNVLLIVNVASRCGFTPQYAGLEELYREYKERGLIVLGFPCNQFGGQEPGSEEEIKLFCRNSYDITFPIFAKVDVNGANAHPLFQYLKEHAPGILGTEVIKWNFTKFLVDKTGIVANRFSPTTPPTTLADDIESLLS